MQHFPLFLDVRRRKALVVGGGDAAARKALLLTSAGARVEVVSPTPGADVMALADTAAVKLHQRPFRSEDISDGVLVIAEADDAPLAEAVSCAAKAAGVPVNVIDRPDLSTFIMPAIVERTPITVAISSSGTAPLLARSIRARIEAMLPANLGRLARFADSFRSAVKATRGTGIERRRFWEGVFAGPIAEAVLVGREHEARERMLAALNRRSDGDDEGGAVHLVGAGPGDPELLTLKALRLLHEADVIVHDALVSPGVLDLARRDAEVIDVGKRAGRASMPQSQINALLAARARAGQRVVRLKGGDPFVFGRGGEERDYLCRCGVPVFVVPGISAALGCAAAAGIPLTHRGVAQTLSIVTAQARGDTEPDLDWAALARPGQTLAIYMGAGVAARIAERLMTHGLSPSTPVAVIAGGTLPGERRLLGTLQDLSVLAGRAGAGPALILVGEVVALANGQMKTVGTHAAGADANDAGEPRQAMG